MKFNRFVTSFSSDYPHPPRVPFVVWRSSMAGASLAACLLFACSDKPTGVQPSPDGSVMGDSGSVTGDSGGTTDSGSATNLIVAACPTSDASAAAVVSFTNETYANDPRLLRKDEAIFTGLNTLDDPYTQKMRLHNGGAAPVTITGIGIAPQSSLFPAGYRQHSAPAAFKATVVAASDAGTDAAASALSLPVTIAAGVDLDVEIQFLSTKTNPPPRVDNTGGEAVAALLVARTSADCVQAGLYGVSLWNNTESIDDAGVPTNNYGRFEPTLGQIIATLGYQVNVGDNLKTYLNVNQVTAFAMAPPPAGDTPSDEVIIRDFVLADPSKPAVLLAPARFAPKVDYPFGWFATGSVSTATAQPGPLAPLKVPGAADFPPGLQYVAALSSVLGSDSYTSDHSEMVFPPIDGNISGTFSPTGSFGLWCFSAQRSDGAPISLLDGSVNPTPLNGDYDYSHDELNIVTQSANPPLPADLVEAGVNFGVTNVVHRYRIWPLKDRAGNAVANSYLIGVEEASNDDYQDMVFTLSNVKPAPPAEAGAAADAGADAAATD
ncbi:MAG: hypothetical protein M3O36_12145 [Myxococcota bacterium]|nr:hypothetical protein [Myxococcota bacterium]